MSHSSPAPFRSRLFRVLITIGTITTFFVALSVCYIQLATMRKLLIDNLHDGVILTSSIIANGIRHKEPFTELVKLLSHPQGLDMICAYNPDNHLILHWQKESYNGYCPSLIRKMGTQASLYSAAIVEPIQSDNTYLGVVYAHATLLSHKAILLHICMTFMLLFLVVIAACFIAADYGSRHFRYLIDAIRQQIDCLKSNSSECLLAPAMATSETMSLFDEISSLRIHVVSSLVPKDTVVHLSKWYENIFFNLFSLIRHRIPANSPLIPLLSDCELFLRLSADESLPEPELTDITHIMDEGLASARALSPPDSQVHLVVSCKPGIIREWKIQAGYLRALIRHLLLIGLARTQKGLICLRLETRIQPSKANQVILYWQLEDSGLPLQPGVLHSRLIALPYKMVSVTEASWWLVARLTQRLGGTIHGENAPEGLLLKGEIPLGYASQNEQNSTQQNCLPSSPYESPRLVLMIGNISNESHSLCLLLESFNCRVFWVTTYIQALELAPALSFSAILLNESSLATEGNSAVRQLLGLMENKLMPVIPLWVVSTSESDNEYKAWMNAGVNQILIAPIQQEKLKSLCLNLIPFNTRFWAVYDTKLLDEFSQEIIARLPEMRAELLAQIQRVQIAISCASKKTFTIEVLHNVHAIKSMALGLGYMHLAAFMANIEQILVGRQTTNSLKNITIIAECLKKIRLD